MNTFEATRIAGLRASLMDAPDEDFTLQGLPLLYGEVIATFDDPNSAAVWELSVLKASNVDKANSGFVHEFLFTRVNADGQSTQDTVHIGAEDDERRQQMVGPILKKFIIFAIAQGLVRPNPYFQLNSNDPDGKRILAGGTSCLKSPSCRFLTIPNGL